MYLGLASIYPIYKYSHYLSNFEIRACSYKKKDRYQKQGDVQLRKLP